MKFDVVVVGAGPAGAKTAYELARKGAKVLIIEKHKLPRFKLCGGCLSARTAALLPEGWQGQVLNEIKKGILGFKGKEFIEKTALRAVAYIIDRTSFDHFLTQKAIEAGAQLWEEAPLTHFTVENTVKISTPKGTVKADFLVGSDGFYTKVGKILGYRKKNFFRSVEFWTEGNLQDSVVIDLGIVSRGYAWIFPKGNMLSIGVATTGRENLKDVLERYVRDHKLLENITVKGLKGWMIPYLTKPEDAHLGRGRILLVGDSANLVDPLLGEGIYYALKSAELCAQSILSSPENPLPKYRNSLLREVIPELVSAGKIANLAYRFQRVAYRMGAGFSLERFFKLLEGEETYESLYRKGMPEFIMSLLHIENFLHIIIDKILRRR